MIPVFKPFLSSSSHNKKTKKRETLKKVSLLHAQ